MAARKRDGRKKTGTRGAAAQPGQKPQKTGGEETFESAALVVAAVSESGTARKAPQSEARVHGAVVHKSTLYICCAFFSLFGILLGTLSPLVRDGREAAPAPRQEQARQDSAAREEEGRDRHILEMEQALRENPQDVNGWIQLGNHYFDARRPRDAVRAYGRALALKPDNPDVLTDMGVMRRQLGEFERAMENFSRAAQLSPLHEQSRFNMGVVLLYDLNRKEEARNAWSGLLSLNPDAKAPDGTPVRELLDAVK
jgi:cytochrome c-type biogenesis protein CcmH/NrfG